MSHWRRSARSSPCRRSSSHTARRSKPTSNRWRPVGRKGFSSSPARRNPQAYAPLYREYVGPVYRYCYRRLGTKELAEDATSQTFTQALRGLEGFENRSFRSWLFSIAYRVVIDIYRKRRPDTALENVAAPSDPDPTPEEAALAREDGPHIRSLLASLTDDQRQVLELRLAGLTGLEIAETLDRSVGSVRLLQHRAIQRLRNLLNIDPETGESSDER